MGGPDGVARPGSVGKKEGEKKSKKVTKIGPDPLEEPTLKCYFNVTKALQALQATRPKTAGQQTINTEK